MLHHETNFPTNLKYWTLFHLTGKYSHKKIDICYYQIFYLLRSVQTIDRKVVTWMNIPRNVLFLLNSSTSTFSWIEKTTPDSITFLWITNMTVWKAWPGTWFSNWCPVGYDSFYAERPTMGFEQFTSCVIWVISYNYCKFLMNLSDYMYLIDKTRWSISWL